eukprot:994273-Pyramimonas_sp.AAC.1
MLFLFGEKGFNEGFKKAWTKHEEWTSTIANASGTQAARASQSGSPHLTSGDCLLYTSPSPRDRSLS